jgi:hypothetical protein
VSIQVVCECGKKLAAKDEMAGKRIRCPACQAVLIVAAPKKPAGGQQTKSARPVEDDEDQEEPRPKRRKPAKDEDSEDVAPPPRRKSRPVDDDEDEDDRPRRKSRPVDEDENEDDRPRRKSRREESDDLDLRRPPSSQIVLRIFVLVFVLCGCASSGFLGFKWYSDSIIPADKKAAFELGIKLDPEKAKTYDNLVTASYLLMLAPILGLVSGVLVFLRIIPKLAVLGFLLPIALPAIFMPMSWVFTCPFLLPAVLGLRVMPKPGKKPEPKRRRSRDEDDEEDDE